MNEPTTDAPAPFYGARGEPSTLRRAINDAIDTYIAYECDTDSERAFELAVEYMFSEYGLKDGETTIIASLRAQLAAARNDVIQRDIWLVDAGTVEQDCRAQLDQARGHVEALVSTIEQTRLQDCTCDRCRAIDAAASAARAFLRRA